MSIESSISVWYLKLFCIIKSHGTVGVVSVDDPDPDLSLAPEFSPPDPNPHQALVISRYRDSLLISKIQFLTILVKNVNFLHDLENRSVVIL